MDPFAIAFMLAHPESHCDRFVVPVGAYRFNAQGAVEPLPADSFSAVEVKLCTMAPEQARAAFDTLPAGVFVFEDEFFPFYQAVNRSISRGRPDEITLIHDVWLTNPLITPEENTIVFEGIPVSKKNSVRVNSQHRKIAQLNSLVQKIEEAAAQLDLPFDRGNISGTKKDFADILTKIPGANLHMALSTLDEYFTKSGCKFKQGTRNGALDDFSRRILEQIGGETTG
jgi:hypothetical protein